MIPHDRLLDAVVENAAGPGGVSLRTSSARRSQRRNAKKGTHGTMWVVLGSAYKISINGTRDMGVVVENVEPQGCC